MHPGRKWAKGTLKNQAKRHEIEAQIKGHFDVHPVIKNKERLFESLALGAAPNAP
ncbi:MAG: hypothetical protein IT582_05980 [Opitutaceae bacterium]|nr:hypothetical protein [Opitutaceae bacterium]